MADAPTFRVRTHRQNPRIVWAESLNEARQTTDLVAALALARAHPEGAPLRTELESDLTWVTEEMANLGSRIAVVESGVAGIYQSRTGQTLVRVGGILQGAAGIMRPQRSHGKNP